MPNYRHALHLHPILLFPVLVALPLALASPPAGALEPGEFDSAPFDSLLKAHVTANGVDYAGWKAGGLAPLDAFLARAASYDPTSVFGKEPRAAFWMNVYNAWAARQVLEHYPVKSLADIPGFFDRNRVRAGGMDLTLAEIESTLAVLLPTHPEFALGLAPGATGGPRLFPVAYTSSNFDSLLTVSMHDLVTRKRIFLDHDTKELHVIPQIERHWENYASLPKGFLAVFSSQLPLADVVSISAQEPKRVVEPVDLTLFDAGTPPPKPPTGKP